MLFSTAGSVDETNSYREWTYGEKNNDRSEKRHDYRWYQQSPITPYSESES